MILLTLLSCGQERTLICMEGHSLGPDEICYPDHDTAVEPEVTEEPAEPVVYSELSAPRLLRRISLDLRGVLPSELELDVVEDEPERVAQYRDAWLTDPLMADRMVQLLGQKWHTRIDEFLIFYLLLFRIPETTGQVICRIPSISMTSQAIDPGGNQPGTETVVDIDD